MNDVMLYSWPMTAKKNRNPFDALFEGVFDTLFESNNLNTLFGANRPGATHRVTKNGDEITIEIDMPGTKASDVSVSFEDNVIHVDYKVRGVDHYQEFRVSRDADIANATAKVADGLFSLTFKRVTPTTKSIKIPVTG